jgi:hypothetical protein
MRFIYIIIIGFAVLFSWESAYCDWTTWIIVNQELDNKQASRDDDCPWAITCDSDGNAYIVWEDRRTDPLRIFMRVRNADGSWGDEELVSFKQHTASYDHSGHPSICVLEQNDTTKIYVAFVDEWAAPGPSDYRELQGSIYDGREWTDPSVYISLNGGDELPFGSGGSWSTNLVVGADNNIYAFWIYHISSTCYRLNFNFTTGPWTPSNETLLYTDTDSTHLSKHMNPCADSDTNIHLVYADKNDDDPYEVYYLCKGPSDNNFGNYPGTQVSSDSDTSSI